VILELNLVWNSDLKSNSNSNLNLKDPSENWSRRFHQINTRVRKAKLKGYFENQASNNTCQNSHFVLMAIIPSIHVKWRW
jgi:hypothetical protein